MPGHGQAFPHIYREHPPALVEEDILSLDVSPHDRLEEEDQDDYSLVIIFLSPPRSLGRIKSGLRMISSLLLIRTILNNLLPLWATLYSPPRAVLYRPGLHGQPSLSEPCHAASISGVELAKLRPCVLSAPGPGSGPAPHPH